jgi:acyl-CoA reductase-like NAD-dependent aldehyde dehydrogenase
MEAAMKWLVSLIIVLASVAALSQTPKKQSTVAPPTRAELRQRIQDLEILAGQYFERAVVAEARVGELEQSQGAQQAAADRNWNWCVAREKELVGDYNSLATRYNSLLDYSQVLGVAAAFAASRPTVIAEPQYFPSPLPAYTPPPPISVSPPVYCNANTVGSYTQINCQ